MTTYDPHLPAAVNAWRASIPQQNVGTFFAKIRSPFFFIARWHRVDAWGQLCDGTDHRDYVHNMLYNKFPNHGKGYTYIAWRCEPDNPEQCKYPRSGKVEIPVKYSGIARDDGRTQ